MPYADLHVHTTRSDGTLEPGAVPEAATRHGVDVVGLTDHDQLPPFAGVIEREGVVLLSGIELRVEAANGHQVDLLGYNLEPTRALEQELDRLQDNRRKRGAAIVDCVEDRLGIDLEVDIGHGFGRPHVAQAIDTNPDTDLDYHGAFADLIGSDGPCYRPRDIPSFETGRQLLGDACQLVSLAHPLRYADPKATLELAPVLDAVERHYPYRKPVETAVVDRTIERYGLLETGGSDAHDDRLGRCGLSRAAFERLEIDCSGT